MICNTWLFSIHIRALKIILYLSLWRGREYFCRPIFPPSGFKESSKSISSVTELSPTLCSYIGSSSSNQIVLNWWMPLIRQIKTGLPSCTGLLTSGKKAIGGALFWLMRGAYGMRHHCHATSNNLSVAHFNMRYAWRILAYMRH
jgi:hypothetical protein